MMMMMIMMLVLQSNKRLTKKLPRKCEVANILVGQVSDDYD